MAGDFKKIVYVGNKTFKTDTVARSGIVWAGQGDVQPVPASIASRLLAYPSVWQEEGVKSAAKKPAAPVVQKEGSVHDEAPDDDHGLAGLSETNSEAEAEGGDGDIDAVADVTTESIVEAISALDRENPDHFTGGGKPKVNAVRDLLGNQGITTSQVAQAWNAMNG